MIDWLKRQVHWMHRAGARKVNVQVTLLATGLVRVHVMGNRQDREDLHAVTEAYDNLDGWTAIIDQIRPCRVNDRWLLADCVLRHLEEALDGAAEGPHP